MRYQRIMHISDLHFGPTERDGPSLDNKAGLSRHTASGLAPSPERQFLDDLRRWCSRREEGEERPQLLIVSGDLVNKGGVSEEGPSGLGSSSWTRVRHFIESVQGILNLKNDRVLVVPGNHDVDFHAPSRDLMFLPWNQAMADYERPRLGANGRFEAHRCRIDGAVEGLSLTVVLLSSPCYVGDTHRGPSNDTGEPDEYLRRLESLFSDLDDELHDRVTSALHAARGRLDIAAIGTQQRRFLQDLGPKEPGEIRIAVLHHHLLPDPQIEVTPFESVIDAGETLDVLADSRFDLVLSGHKHHRRLATYIEAGGHYPLHVYTGHSLFETGRTPSGVSLIDLWAPTDPLVASIRFLERNLTERSDLLLDLIRNDYVNPEVLRVCQTIDAQRQQEILLPVLSGLAQSLARMSAPESNYAKVERLFDRVIEVVRDDLTKLGAGTMVLRPPNLAQDWATLVEAVGHGNDRCIRLVSDGDLDYWLHSIGEEGEPAAYASVLKDYPDKQRILVLRRSELDSSDATVVIGHMIAEGYRVFTVPLETVDRETWTDFAILGDLGAGRFLGRRDGSMVRALEESFDRSALEMAETHWNDLMNNPELRDHNVPP